MERVHLAGVNWQDTYLHWDYNDTVLYLRSDDLYQEPGRWCLSCKSMPSIAVSFFMLSRVVNMSHVITFWRTVLKRTQIFFYDFGQTLRTYFSFWSFLLSLPYFQHLTYYVEIFLPFCSELIEISIFPWICETDFRIHTLEPRGIIIVLHVLVFNHLEITLGKTKCREFNDSQHSPKFWFWLVSVFSKELKLATF